jgi:hypothetical protein
MSRALITALFILAVTVSAAAAENEPAPTALDLSALDTAMTILPENGRPGTLTAMYVGFVGLQVLDARTTMSALRRGAHETNPFLGSGHSGVVWAVKAASTASTIFFVERVRKRNRIRAILLMAGINGGYVALAAHNARQAR